MKRRVRILSLLLASMLLVTAMPVSAAAGGITAEELKASMQNANELPSPTDPDERAARGAYLPYTGYFEETYTEGPAAGRSVRIYIPEGAYVRDYFLTMALPSGTDVEQFLVDSGWIDLAEAERLSLMILLPEDGTWGTYEQERDYVKYLMEGAGSGRRWYSVYSVFYVVGYGDGGDVLQQWAAEEPLFVISQAYFDAGLDPALLEEEGEFYYIPDPENAQRSETSATPVETTFECVQKKEIPVPTYFFGADTPQGDIDYWMRANECDGTAEAGAGPLGSDLYRQNKENSRAIATAYSNVVSQVGVLARDVDYVDSAVTRAVYEALAVYTRYTNTSAWSNALGFRPDHEALGIETVDILTTEQDGRTVKRTYMVYVPKAVKDTSRFPDGAPVLYAFGGLGNNATQYFEASQYVEIADTYGFTLVMPSEHTTDNGVTTGWRIGEDEYNFVKTVMAEVNGKYGAYIDQDRVYALGHSQGGGMVNYLSCREPELFTAYAIMAGLSYEFPAGTPAVPMYTIYGEYDSVPYEANRVQWLQRLGFREEDAVVTDPFDLPQRYGNPIEYLLYPDTAEYPGDKFVTYTWYDENGLPMFNDTTAYGREHNNTVPDAWRIWEEWFSLWDRDENGNRVYLGELGPVSGDAADGSATATRAALVSMLYEREGRPAAGGASAFTDVADDADYAAAVAWADANGLATGYGDGRFGPDDTVTREQMAAILYRYAQYKGYDTAQGGDGLAGYADAGDVSGYAQEAMAWAVDAGVLTADGGALNPDGVTTVSEAEATLQRLGA